jgi:hypothetical protein
LIAHVAPVQDEALDGRRQLSRLDRNFCHDRNI